MHPHLYARLEVLRNRRGFNASVYLDAKVELLNEYVRKTGISSLVVGVSGGIDSAVVLSLAMYASRMPGSRIKKVVGVCLPYLKLKKGVSNQKDATSRGKAVIASVGAESMVIDLTESHKTLKDAVDREGNAKGEEWASGQLVSYLRTPALYYVTALLSQSGFPSMVLGTTNRDEGAYIGYFGKAADAMNDVQLISDLHKSEVYLLARLLGNIPAEIVNAVPAGDIYDGRTDEELIGVPYDFIELHALCLTLAHPSEANSEFQDPAAEAQWIAWYDRVEQLHRENKHKYLGGSPALHFDVYPRAISGGWKPQNEESDPPEHPNASAIVNLVPLLPDCLNLVENNLLQAFKTHSLPKVKRTVVPGFGDSLVSLSPILSEEECSKLLSSIQSHDFTPAGIDGMKLPTKNSVIGSFRMSFYSLSFANALWRRISPHISAIRKFDEYCFTDFAQHTLWRAVSVSPLFRVIKYEKDGYLIPHYDSPYSYSTSTKTLMSVVIYLTDQTHESEAGGRTRFIIDRQRYLPQQERIYKDWTNQPQPHEILFTVSGERGSALIFDHRILHDSEVLKIVGKPKIILRTDIVFEQCGLSSGEELSESHPLGKPRVERPPPRGAPISKPAKRQKFPQHQPIGKAFKASTKGPGGGSFSVPKLKSSGHLSTHPLALEGDRLYRKHLKDPFYSSVLAITGSWENVLEAGFFDDGAPAPDEVKDWKPQWEAAPLNWFSTPVSKIRRRLSEFGTNWPEDKWLAVVLSTGSFNPIHNGHIDMMEQGKLAIEANGGYVLGGYISPSHDLYVSSKLRGEALSARHRLHLCELATQHSDWLMADGWEALDLHYPVNFTDVIIHLEQYLAAHIPTHKPIQIVYVYGSDHAGFGMTFVDRGKAVCLHRPGSEKKFAEFAQYFEQPKKNVIFWDPPTLHVSSTEVRKGNKHGLLPEAVLTEYRALKKRLHLTEPPEASQIITYHLRNEGKWAYQHFQSAFSEISTSSPESTPAPNFKKAWKTFCHSVQEAIVNAHALAALPDERKIVEFNIVTLSEQRQSFEQIKTQALAKGCKVLSLDAVLPGDENIQVSRAFSIASSVEPCRLSPRPGAASIAGQIQLLSPGDYILFDDDSFTGETLKTVKSEILNLRKDITIREVMTLTDSKEHEGLIEISDLRDFLLGSHQGGLVVSQGDSQLSRAPYALPYVSPSQRVSIPRSQELEFSIAIWKANTAFFESVSDQLCVSHMDPATQSLLLNIGFSASKSCLEVAQWHLKRLEEMWEHQPASSGSTRKWF